MGISRELANQVLSFQYHDIPKDVIHQVKRIILDTLGCAIGGYSSETSSAIRSVIQELKHPEESTVFGNGIKTSCLNAILANGAMVRFLDYNDTAFIIQGETYRTGYHPSEIIPFVLALGERENLSGKEVITSIVLGYDLSIAFLEGIQGQGMERRGWNGDTRGAYIVPLIAGRILGLNASQIENAIGISGSFHAVLGILDTPAEEYTMAKNIRFPMMAYGGLLATFLAQKGFTGPTTIFEGHDGLNQVIMGGEYNFDRLLNFKNRFAIRETCIKSIIADYSSHGHLTATLELVHEYNITPEEIKEIKITTSKRCAEHTGDPIKKFPKNKETADHSSYFLTAIAVVDREIGPDQFTPEKYRNPKILELIEKITIQGDPNLDKFRPSGISEILTKDGKKYSRRVDYPKGHAKNPMTDEEIIQKFKKMGQKVMGAQQMNQLIEVVFNIDRLENIHELIRLMVFDQ